ncbi:RNA polymerase subunit sigma [bacterium]|nr:sigma-70 family RNA polymerase sigma factor [Chloroflexi bacterium CFX6]RIL11731.1 MAG: RNA polymerase subunit sigma [bacterium]
MEGDAAPEECPDGLKDHLLEVARTRGEVTRHDLLAAWPEAEDAPEALADLVAALDAAGVELDTGIEPPVHLQHHFFDLTGIESDDTVSLYLREVGNIPLLTAEQEVDLARRIERGRDACHALSNGVAPRELSHVMSSVADGEAARHHLTKANSRLVIAMAKKYMNQGVPFLDLIQEGNLGLMKAVEKFDWRRGYKFSTYATWWVRQAITRAIADQGRTIRVPVHMSDRIRRLFQVSRQLEQMLGREPTLEEISVELGMPNAKVQWMMRIARAPLSLEKPVGDDRDSELGDFIEDDEFPAPPEAAAYELLCDEVETLLTALPPREARVLELRFGLLDGRTHTLKEVGEKFGVTRERIRQIETEALERLRLLGRASRLREFLEVD